MKKAILLAMILAAPLVSADQYVRGHLRSNGTYVQGYHRSSPNGTRLDNYSTQGNVNPYTGQSGSRPAYGSGYQPRPIAPLPYPSLYGR